MRFEQFEDRRLLALSDLDPAVVDGPNTGTIGREINVYADVANLWSGATGNYTAVYALTTNVNNPVTSAYWPLKTVTRPSIAGNGHDRWTESVPIPTWAPAGLNRLILIADPSNFIAEGNEGNNLEFDAGTIILSSPSVPADLKGDWVDVQNTATQWGQTVAVQKVVVQNAGAGAAGAFQVQWYLSRDKFGSSDDILLPQTNGATSYTHGGIAANSYGPEFAVNLKLPNALPSGWSGSNFFVVMKTDSAGQVQETNESNNFGGAPNATYDWDNVTIENPVQPADLKGDWVDVQNAATQWGQTVAVQKVVVQNAGAGAAGAFQVQWYLSRDKFGSSDDILLPQTNGATSYTHGGIAANSYGPEFAVNLKLPNALPSGWSGSNFFVVMKTDSAGQVQETNESNNFGGAPSATYDWDNVTITAPPSQDVHLTNVRFVSQVIGPNNHLCQFASAAMLMSQAFGFGGTRSMMQALAFKATGNVYADPGGADVLQTTRAVEIYTGSDTTVTGNAGWLTYEEVKQALRNGHAVSIGLNYEFLGNARADHYKNNGVFVGGHQVVVTGFSEVNQTWTFFDPLQPTERETTVSSTTFRQAVDAQGGNGYWVSGWYFK
ncbi:MAG: CARDB domain-containing protein [Planctomycetota bacterium]